MEYCSLAKRFQKTVGTIRNKLVECKQKIMEIIIWAVSERRWWSVPV